MSTFPSRTVEKETLHTVSLLEPHLAGCGSLLDIGCGSGFVAWQLARCFPGEIWTVDIDDFRRVPTPNFTVFDGVALPFPDDRFDVVTLAFVLHHVPDVLKPLLLAEARRVARRTVFVLEDTPITWLDRVVSNRHGARFRRRIRSEETFGFLTREQWLRLFLRLGFRPAYSRRLTRLCRSVFQPFSRSVFVLDKWPATLALEAAR